MKSSGLGTCKVNSCGPITGRQVNSMSNIQMLPRGPGDKNAIGQKSRSCRYYNTNFVQLGRGNVLKNPIEKFLC